MISLAGCGQPSTPVNFFLSQNAPNPFNASTTIMYGLPEAGEVVITITNIYGQQVRTLVNKVQKEGFKRVRWNGSDDDGNPLGSGIYFINLKTADNFARKKMILLK